MYILVNIKKENSLFNGLTLKTKYSRVFNTVFILKNLQSGILVLAVQLSGSEESQGKETYSKKLLGRNLENIFIFQSCLKGEVIAGL